ncbi:hypothetical protein ISS40_07950 [Candidatus Bathyarchaeota archaeon]|nr:hypothetical protein [Candidatus Bathyarchaeota archaeon]
MERKGRARDRTIRDDLELMPEGHSGHEFYVGLPLGEELGRVIYDERKPEKKEE